MIFVTDSCSDLTNDFVKKMAALMASPTCPPIFTSASLPPSGLPGIYGRDPRRRDL